MKKIQISPIGFENDEEMRLFVQSCEEDFEKTLDVMKKTYGTNANDVVVTIGPCICKSCYEVSKELFDKNKILSGLLKACEKRPVNAEAVADEVESEIINSLKREITSNAIGDMVMMKLKAIDDVAYVRFASVHREFKDIDTFMQELAKLKNVKDGE